MIPYGRHSVDESDIQAVVEVLRSDWLTTGPLVDRFEGAVADYVGAEHGVAVANGTAALHAAMYAAGIGPGDEVIVPAMTFAATANAVVFQGGTPVFADVDPDTLLIDPEDAESRITERTKALVAVDYAGQPCDYEALWDVAKRQDLILIADACHAIGAEYKGQRVGSLADLSTFSFHPVKHITTGEGGMVTTDHDEYAQRMRTFRNHGITTDHRQRAEQGTWFYEMVDLGYNYRITDIQCALGLSQLQKLPHWLRRRREIAARYDEALADMPGIQPLKSVEDAWHAYHLYVIKVVDGLDRGWLFDQLRAASIGVNVHYIPVHLHPYYRERFDAEQGQCPHAESVYERIMSLPMFPGMSDQDVADVIGAIHEVASEVRTSA